jgi:O-antigen ligase
MVALIYLMVLNSLIGGGAMRLRALVLIICVLAAPAFTGLLGLWQFVTGTGPASFAVAEDFVRAYGTIGQPNSFAGYMNMGWPLAVALTAGAGWALWTALRHQKKPGLYAWFLRASILLGAGVASGLLLAALLVSFSRGGWVGAVGGGAAMGVALLFGLERQARRHLWAWGMLAALGVALLLVLGSAGVLPTALTERAGSIINNLRLFDVRDVEATPENFAVVERMAQIQAAWSMFSEHPLVGVGPGNYTNAYEGHVAWQADPYLFHPWYASRGHAHNYYLHIAAEAGIIGLSSYLLVLVLLAVQAIRTLRRAHGWFWRSITVGCCGIIGAIAVHNLFENLHVLNMGIQMGAVWGLLAATEQNTEDT